MTLSALFALLALGIGLIVLSIWDVIDPVPPSFDLFDGGEE